MTLGAPLAAQPGGALDLEGWIRGDLPAGSLTLEVAGDGWTFDLPTRLERAEDGRVAAFELARPLDARRLPLGLWGITARFEGRGAASRRPLGSFLSGAPPRPYGDLGPWLLALAVLLAPSRGRWRWLPCGAVVACGWLAASMLLPAALPV